MYERSTISDETIQQAIAMKKEAGISLMEACKKLGVNYWSVYSRARRMGAITAKGFHVCPFCGKRTEDKKANYCSCCGKKIPTEKDDAEVALQTIRKMVSELPGHYRDSAARAIAELGKYIKNH